MPGERAHIDDCPAEDVHVRALYDDWDDDDAARAELRDPAPKAKIDWSKIATAPRRFKEAIAAFRKRAPMTKEAFDKLTTAAKARAFTVSGVAQLDVVAHAWELLDKAVAEGTTIEEFKKAAAERIVPAWKGSVANPPHRLETIFRTNVQTAYSAGRFEQATDPDVLDLFPFWQFDAVLDDRTTELCRGCDGTVLAADADWWKSHHPPLHHNCRSGVVTLTKAAAHKAGVSKRAPTLAAADGFGAAPGEVEPFKPSATDYPAELWKAHEAKASSPAADAPSGATEPVDIGPVG